MDVHEQHCEVEVAEGLVANRCFPAPFLFLMIIFAVSQLVNFTLKTQTFGVDQEVVDWNSKVTFVSMTVLLLDLRSCDALEVQLCLVVLQQSKVLWVREL